MSCVQNAQRNWVFRSFLLAGFCLGVSYCKSKDGGGDSGPAPSPTQASAGASASQTVVPPYATYPNTTVATVDPTNGCSSSGCQKAVIEISVNGNATRRLNIQVKNPVTWAFAAKSTNFPSRTIQVFRIQASPQPASMQITGNGTASVSVSWTPASSDPASGDLQITARDVTACNTAKGANTAGTTTTTPAVNAGSGNCDDFNSQNPSWDETQSFQWALQGGSNTGGGSNGTGNILLGVGLGAMIGILTGQGFPGSLQSTLPLLFGGLVGGGLGNGIMYSGQNPYGYQQGGIGGYGQQIGMGANNCFAYSQQFLCQSAGCLWNYNQCVNANGIFQNGIQSQYPNSYPYNQNGINNGTGYNTCSNYQQFQCQPPQCIWNGSYCANNPNQTGIPSGGNPLCTSQYDQVSCQQNGCTWNGSSCY